MNSVIITDASTDKPLRSFVDGATTFVCWTDGSQSQLSIAVEQPGFLMIESDEEELERIPVDHSTAAIPLDDILTRPLPHARQSMALSMFRYRAERPTPAKITRFSAVIAQSAPDSQVAATFNFQLLDPEEFEVASAQHLQTHCSRSNCCTPGKANCGPTCWNCSASCNESRCPNCQAEQQD